MPFMTDPIHRVSALEADRRRAARRRNDPSPTGFDAARSEPSNPPMVSENPPAPSRPSTEASAAAYATQLMGQGGQKRGLRGGQPVLQKARSAYLEAEWSGPQDRRPPSGGVARTKI